MWKSKVLRGKNFSVYKTLILSLFFLLAVCYLGISNYIIVNFKFQQQYIYYFIAAILKELVFLFPLLIFLLYLRIKKNDIIDILLLSLIFVIGLVNGLKNNAGLFSALISMKDYTLLYIFLLFTRYKPIILFLKKIKLEFIYLGIACVFLVNFIYTVWMYLNFKGDLDILWFYNYYQNAYFNYIRDGHLRATGFFDTPIQASIFFGFTTILFWYGIFYSLRKYKSFWLPLLYFFFMLLSILGIYMTHTRIGLIIVLIALIVGILKKFKLSSFSFLIATLMLVLFSFFYIIFYSQDPSARGRIIQYENLFNMLIENKFLLYYGYGFGAVGPKFENIAADSAIIEAIYNFGLLGAIIYIYLFIRLIKKIYKDLPRTQANKHLFEFLNIFFLSLLYLSFFHSLVGKVVFQIFVLFISITLSKTYSCKQNIKSLKNE